MDEVILTTEIIVGVAFLLAAVFLVVTLVRRRLIAANSVPSLCALRLEGHRWRSGLLKQTPETLEWYRLFGVTPRPGHVWRRGSLEVTEVGQTNPSTVSRAIGIAAPIQATFVTDDSSAPGRFDLVMATGAYTALRAWLEAAPPTDDRYGS